jgi:ankyrin repeat protein
MAEDAFELFRKAVQEGRDVELRQLIERNPGLKARINEPVFAFDSPAIVAAAGSGKLPVIDALLGAGADINARSQWWAGGFGVLDCANAELSRELIKRGAVVDVHAAARLGMLEKLRQLVSANPGLVHARGGDGQTPLHFAANMEIAAYLLDHGADINARDIDHESTAAQYQVRDRPEVARYLIQRGSKTDILMAAAIGDAGLVRKHLDEDPESIRTSVSDEFFPMRDPHAGGTIYIWTLGKFKSAHHIAREFGHKEIVQLLMDRSAASPEVMLINACWLGDEAIARTLAAAHPNLVGSMPPADRHQITNAAEMNNTEAVRLMLECGWPLDGDHGTTPLHFASWHGNAEMVRLILRHHPPLEKRDPAYAATPLGWAIHGSENGWHRNTGNYGATVEALLEAGAKAPDEIAGSAAVRTALATANLRRQSP